MFPAVVVDARGQLRNVVGRCITLDIRNFAEIVHRVRGVGGAAPHPEEKESAAVAAQSDQSLNDSGYVVLRKPRTNRLGLLQVGLNVPPGITIHCEYSRISSTASLRSASRRSAACSRLSGRSSVMDLQPAARAAIVSFQVSPII